MPDLSTLYLLDGMALAYRAYHAFSRSPIVTSAGRNVSAVLGFANSLLEVLGEEDLTHVAVVFDLGRPEQRMKLYPQYKAHREKTPEDLLDSIGTIKELCQALGVKVLEQEGYEADDIVGTLVSRVKGHMQVVMITPDKDFAQLVDTGVFMRIPPRGKQPSQTLGIVEVCDKWKVKEPSQVIDILALWGDSADNIPGVRGVGEKTAQKLLADYGSLENILEHASEIKGKLGENLQKEAEIARLSKQLATIDCAVPIAVDIEELVRGTYQDEQLKSLLRALEFNSLAKRLYGESFHAGRTQALQETGKKISITRLDTQKVTYKTIRTVHELRDSISYLKGFEQLAIDLETTSLDPRSCEILGVSLSVAPFEAFFVDTGRASSLSSVEALELLEPLFSSSQEKIGHHLKFDLSVLACHGVDVQGVFFDTMLVHSLCFVSQRHNLDYLAESLLAYRPIALEEVGLEPQSDLFGKEERKKKGKKAIDMLRLDPNSLAQYACEDAEVSFRLAQHLKPLLEASGQKDVYWEIEAPLLPVLVKVEHAGIRIDTEELQNCGRELEREIALRKKAIFQEAQTEFNLNSPKQLGSILFDKMALVDQPKKTATGQWKTDEKTLQALSLKHPFIADILTYRELFKLSSTYVSALPRHLSPVTGRLHTHFRQLFTSTGRLASSDPNLQNIPVRSAYGKRIRKAFIAREKGYSLLSLDYSQIELRILAALSNDETLADIMRQGGDIHAQTASFIEGVSLQEVNEEMRRRAKTINFGIIYGMSPFGLSQSLRITRHQATSIIDAYFKRFPKVLTYMDACVEEAKAKGYVTTLCGRQCPISNANSRNATIANAARRVAINAPVQGSAADMIKKAMVEVDKILYGKKTKLILQVHDELVFDFFEEEGECLVGSLVKAMEEALPLPGGIPCTVGVGRGQNWLEAH